MNGYFSVFDPTGKKIADCGALRDAVTLIGFRNAKWEGHYYQFTPVYQTIDINSKKYFPSDDIVVNMDGGVGGSWKQIKPEDEEYVHINDDPHDGWWLRPEHRDDVLPQLQESDLEPFNP